MAYNDTAVSADELTAKNNDAPMLIGNNLLESFNAAAQWRVSGEWTAGTDVTVSGAPTRLAHDRNGKIVTRGSATTSTISLIFDIEASTSRAFDTVAIIGHNYAQSLPANVFVDISDNANFAGFVEVATFAAPTTSKRKVSLSLTTGMGSNRRIDNIRYVRIRHEKGVNFSIMPQIGEVILGRRRQLTAKAQIEFQDAPLRSSVTDFRSESGTLTRHKLYSGAGDRELNFKFGALTTTLDSEVSLRDWFTDCDNGSKAFGCISIMLKSASNSKGPCMFMINSGGSSTII